MKVSVMAIVLLWGLGGAAASGNGGRTVGGNASGTVEVHSRQRRYIVFPKGASLQMILEVLTHLPTQFKLFVGPTVQIAWPLPSEPSGTTTSSSGGPVDEAFSLSRPTASRYKLLDELAGAFSLFGMTVGLAWQLPDDPQVYSDLKKKHKMYKRSAFKKMEAFMRPGGADGRQCVLKALCESGQRTPSKKEFVTEILHKIFSYNTEDEDIDETHEDKLYRKAHRSVNQNCETLYPDCSFSIFNAIN